MYIIYSKSAQDIKDDSIKKKTKFQLKSWVVNITLSYD